jgi:hypothetical protein
LDFRWEEDEATSFVTLPAIHDARVRFAREAGKATILDKSTEKTFAAGKRESSNTPNAHGGRSVASKRKKTRSLDT